ncbi:MAG: TonB-dependent receptor [Rikenellaceae bacterium]
MTKMNFIRCRHLKMALLLFLLLSSAQLFAQDYNVVGVVRDKSHNPLVGVSVIQAGSYQGATTNNDGEYSIKVDNKNATLLFEYLGYVSQEITLGGATSLDVTMEEDSYEIDAVVAIGYGQVKQKDLTTSVSIVGVEDIETRPVSSVSGVLQGKAAGVQVIQASGSPGEGMIVRVRGASSISSSNDPLYVVDGVPVGEGNYAIAYLSPNEIESMQVLKDASSAAIYGSRAANGVVLITTKGGSKSREPQISMSAFWGVSNVAKTYDVLNTAQYIDLMDEIGAVTGLPDDLTDQTDWFDETYSMGVKQNYQFSIANGNGDSSYYIGGGYTDEQGIISTTSSTRYNVKGSFDAKIYDWLSINGSATYSDYVSKGSIITGYGSNRAGVVVSAITTPTYAPIWDEDNPDQYYSNFYGANLTSSLENIARTDYNQTTTDRVILSGGATIKFSPNLTFKSTISMDAMWVNATTYLDPVRTSYGRTQNGEASESRSEDVRMVYDNILTYNKSFGLHNLELMGGTSATVSKWAQLYASSSYFSTDGVLTNINGGNNSGLQGSSTSSDEWTIMSYLARVSYNYDSKYLFTANVRSDGSSKLAPDYRWGIFPSLSAAWRISAEDFMDNVDFVDDLKFRAGWGQTGNQSGLSSYSYMQLYNTTYYDWSDSTYAQATPTVGDESNIKNDELKWETTTQTNIGIDLATLNNRLNFTIDYYYKYTRDMLMSVPMPSPYPDITRNEGEMSNQGIELVISSVNIAKKDFTWTTDFNISHNKNKLEKLDLQEVYYYGMTADVVNDYAIRMEPGQSLSMFYGYISEGVDPETGDLIYSDLNDDGQITPSDKTYIGDANPLFTFGLTNNLSYKGFNLSVMMTGSYGNDIFNASRIETEGMYNGNNQTTNTLNRWQIPGQITDMPRATSSAYNLKNSTRWIEDGSYLKIKNITLSYNISSAKLNRLNIKSIQPYVSLENFFTFTAYSGYDPEVSQYSDATTMGIDWGTYPCVKTVIGGVNINF